MDYSVVIPAHNAAHLIGEALESVFTQTVPPACVIVVDDGSSDDTAEVAGSFNAGVRVIRQDNHGPGHATSRGIRAVSHNLVATLDADDIWIAHKMERQIEALAENPDLHLVFSLQRQFRHGQGDLAGGLVREGLNRSSMTFYRSVFQRVGDIIDPPGGRGDLVDWLARVREEGFRFCVLDEVLCLRRIIAGSLSYGRDTEKDRGYLAVAHRAMQRRKTAK